MKVALVTGATRGIGKAIAQSLAARGFAVVVTGRTVAAGHGRHDGMWGVAIPGSLDETIASIAEAGGVAIGARLDLLDRASIDAALKTTLDQFGRLDVLVNNAIYQGPVIMQKVLNVAMEEAELSLRGNFLNQFYLSRKALELMLPQKAGRLIFMSTLSSVQPTVGSSGLFYNAAKAALNKIPDYINFEHGKDGISAFLIEPQFTLTDTLRASLGAEADAIGFGQRARAPEETARTVAWLASHPDAARFAGPAMLNAPDFFAEHGVDPDA